MEVAPSDSLGLSPTALALLRGMIGDLVIQLARTRAERDALAAAMAPRPAGESG